MGSDRCAGLGPPIRLWKVMLSLATSLVAQTSGLHSLRVVSL